MAIREAEQMCVVSVAWRAHPDWILLAAGNRDEYHARPTATLQRWDAYPAVLAGRDLVSGGTWMGISEAGRFVVVTNVSGLGLPDPALESRGKLVSDILSGTIAPAALEQADLDRFNAFNLIAIDKGRASVMTNRPSQSQSALPDGLHSLSNGLLTSPWPRKDDLDQRLKSWLSSDAQNWQDIFTLLSDEQIPAGRDGSAIKIRDETYGTRCSTVVAIDHRGNGIIAERSFSRDGAVCGETDFAFSWPT